jgi:hypothetical protein
MDYETYNKQRIHVSLKWLRWLSSSEGPAILKSCSVPNISHRQERDIWYSFNLWYFLLLIWRSKICDKDAIKWDKFSRLQSPAHAGSSLADFSTLKMEAIRSFETSVHTRSTRRHIPEDGILHIHRCENLRSYMKYIVYVVE